MRKKSKAIIVFRWAQAVFIAAVFHLSLLYLFSAPEQGNANSVKHVEHICILPLVSAPQNKDELIWINYNDPTLIAMPNEKYGYSSYIRGSGLNFPSNGSPVLIERMSKLEEEIEIDPIPLLPMKSFSHLETGALQSLSPPSRIVRSSAVLSNAPICMDEKGNVQPVHIKLEPAFVGKVKDKPVHSTKISLLFNPNGFLPNARVSESCGVREYDILALKSILAQCGKLSSLNDKRLLNLVVSWPK